MENMPYQSHLDTPASLPAPLSILPGDRRQRLAHGLPTLTAGDVSLRELRASDAPALFAALTSEQVSRFISPPPASVEGFERFIAWTIRQRQSGQYVCFAVVTAGLGHRDRHLPGPLARTGVRDGGVGLRAGVGVLGHRHLRRRREADCRLRVRSARRAPARSARGAEERPRQRRAAETGAVQEGVLRRSFVRNGEYMDQALWTILHDEWIQAKTVWGCRVIH